MIIFLVWPKRLLLLIILVLTLCFWLNSVAIAQEPSLQGIFDNLFGVGAIQVDTEETGTETFTTG